MDGTFGPEGTRRDINESQLSADHNAHTQVRIALFQVLATELRDDSYPNI
jgi:hypothetical protein